eukprot:CAMPEP_0179094868 /NCGR_PEP_ID=MMETSP0796-20121207/43529_1 /TAXON_ID=73915 /ORGANISM="Pyrodinium bahamense, Strain pbaha01" /LENGTH=201 /DNA_ID=CAMNT_0020792547 /DNA_START=63 /DNA_END=668 /DNA_ORIENTATION=-
MANIVAAVLLLAHPLSVALDSEASEESGTDVGGLVQLPQKGRGLMHLPQKGRESAAGSPFMIRFVNSTLCVSATMEGHAAPTDDFWGGETVHLWPCDTQDGNQQWQFNRQKIESTKNSTFCLSSTDLDVDYVPGGYMVMITHCGQASTWTYAGGPPGQGFTTAWQDGEACLEAFNNQQPGQYDWVGTKACSGAPHQGFETV